MLNKFPKVLAAARQIEIDQWSLGDALIEECGEPIARAARDYHDGSRAILEECSEFLAVHGLPDYDVTYLAKLRQTAFDFQGRNRKTGMSWSTHNEAGNPETLKAVVEATPDRKVTRDRVREVKEAVSLHNNLHEIARAAEKFKGPSPPARFVGHIEPREVPHMVAVLEITNAINKAEDLLTKATGETQSILKKIGDVEIGAINEAFLAAAEAARNGASVVNPTKRGRLTAVGE